MNSQQQEEAQEVATLRRLYSERGERLAEYREELSRLRGVESAMENCERERATNMDRALKAESGRDRYRETIQSFISTVLTVKRENQPEWMEYLAERINDVCEVIGEEDRVTYYPSREAILPTKK